MNILIIGSGGREHALAWKLAQSPECSTLFIAPGNAGTPSVGINLDIKTHEFNRIAGAIRDLGIGLLVIGPEQPLADGLTDFLHAEAGLKDLLIVGPGRLGAQLESSKDFAKAFMLRHGIPTAAYLSVNADTLDKGLQFLQGMRAPYVLKADGLAAGKGVIITESFQEAADTLRDMLGGRFGKASATVVIEEFLKGVELSVFALTDGISYCLLPEAKDYKRIGEGDTGPNTGGMGSVSPVPFARKDFMRKVEQRIVEPTVQGLAREGIPYKGFLFFGLMNVQGEPYVIEYNVRMGDPETQSVMPRITSDLVPLLCAAARAELAGHTLEISPSHALTIVLASGGYPDAFEKGFPIMGLEEATEALVFQAGTAPDDEGKAFTAGGRVLSVTALAPNAAEARAHAYAAAGLIQFENSYMRPDLGLDLITGDLPIS
ncbi:MAG TPA: phosphoribosylamine--glycine ligase [Bacteroidales bacterium]|nr:phosphoribosylamine--glycine ligase [Bacteroidales bacterium]